MSGFVGRWVVASLSSRGRLPAPLALLRSYHSLAFIYGVYSITILVEGLYPEPSLAPHIRVVPRRLFHVAEWAKKVDVLKQIVCSFVCLFRPIPRPSSSPLFCLSFLDIAQIRGHKASSSPSSSQLRFLPCIFNREKTPSLSSLPRRFASIFAYL